MATKKIYIGADHGAFELKTVLMQQMLENGFEVKDMGTGSTESCDYPDFAFAVAEQVASDPGSVGVVMCKSGIGVTICANKVKGIRAALCRDKEQARLTRQHNDSNVLALGANDVGPEEVYSIFHAWISESFEGGRHERRVKKIKDFEENQ